MDRLGAKADAQRPTTRQGAIYGALEALQAAERALREPDEFQGRAWHVFSPHHSSPAAAGRFSGVDRAKSK